MTPEQPPAQPPARPPARPAILDRTRIEQALEPRELLDEMADALRRHAEGRATVPAVGYLAFTAPPVGDVHIKSGYVEGGEYFVVKVASAVESGAGGTGPHADGMMLLFRRDTGAPSALLLDGGYLTTVRTAAAGALSARLLANRPTRRIGVLGTGAQARAQLAMLTLVTDCRDVVLWGRNEARTRALGDEMGRAGFRVSFGRNPAAVASVCDLVVTTTGAREPLLTAADVLPGTHITAVGADAPGKQELDPALVVRADVIVADSVNQCVDHGELAHAVRAGLLDPGRIVELGGVVAEPWRGRSHRAQITVADLTGVGVQDLCIAEHVWRRAGGHGGVPRRRAGVR